jgi:parvulin-like peptidyl-prolyl isomerase
MAEKWGTFLLFCLLLLSGACRQRPPEESPLLIRINDKTISLEQFQKEFNRSYPLSEKLPEEERSEMEKALITELIDRTLVRSEADRLGIRISDQAVEKSFRNFWSDVPPQNREAILSEHGISAVQWRQEEEQRLLQKEVAMQAIRDQLQVSEKEIEAYYREHFAEFKGEEQVRARQILLADEDKARHVLSLLRQGESFADLARRHSLSPEAAQGGDLGFFPRGQMPEEFDAVLFQLPPGRTSDIVKTPYGFHLFLVEEHRKPVKPSLEDVREEIASILLERKKETAYNKWLMQIRSKAFIEIDWSLLKHPQTKPQPAPK